MGWVSLFWGASLGDVHCGGAFWGYFKLTGKTTYLVVRKFIIVVSKFTLRRWKKAT